jgi:hypothetical protein
MNLKKNIKVFTSKFVGTGPSSYKKKRIYRATVSQGLRNTDLRLSWSLYSTGHWRKYSVYVSFNCILLG